MPEPNPARIMTFASSKDLGRWLMVNHAIESELWVKIFKKKTGIPSVTWDDVVVETLCWGWIDGVKKSLDDQAYLQRVTPRKARSNWYCVSYATCSKMPGKWIPLPPDASLRSHGIGARGMKVQDGTHLLNCQRKRYRIVDQERLPSERTCSGLAATHAISYPLRVCIIGEMKYEDYNHKCP
jgi:hypothetical protein